MRINNELNNKQDQKQNDCSFSPLAEEFRPQLSGHHCNSEWANLTSDPKIIQTFAEHEFTIDDSRDCTDQDWHKISVDLSLNIL